MVWSSAWMLNSPQFAIFCTSLYETLLSGVAVGTSRDERGVRDGYEARGIVVHVSERQAEGVGGGSSWAGVAGDTHLSKWSGHRKERVRSGAFIAKTLQK